MNNPIITILIVNYNSSDFVALSLYAIKNLTKYPYKIFIIDNNSKKSDYKRLVTICSKYKNCILEHSETSLRGSTAHGTALNYLVSKVDTPYFSILDSDASWLIKNWDHILINQIDNRVKVIGTQAPIGSKKPQDFPLMFAILFETETFKKLNIDFRPSLNNIYLDTGNELQIKYLSAGFKGKILNMKNTRYFKKGPFKDVICGEYYLDGIDQIVASHFGRGSSVGEQKYRKEHGILYNLPLIGKYFRLRKGKNQKKTWLEISSNIIDSQI